MKSLLQRAYYPIFLIFFVSYVAAQPVMLTDSLSTNFSEFIVTAQDKIVFINSRELLSFVNIDDPFNVQNFPLDWLPENSGWEESAEIKFVKSSPDGNYICLAFSVSLPDTSLPTEIAIPDPILVLVCNQNGGNVREIGLISNSSNGISIDFTQDSRLLYGAKFLPCLPNPDSYFIMNLGDQSSLIHSFDVVDFQEGARFSSNGIIGDKFISNPWSDLIITGSSSVITIADMSTFSILYEDSSATLPTITQWIEPNVALLKNNENQMVRFIDGTIYESQEEPFLILNRISENNYIFTRNEGESIRKGSIDWSAFVEIETSELTELIGYLSLNSKILTVNSGTGIVFSAGRGLYYYEF